jgi:hypothetical protein
VGLLSIEDLTSSESIDRVLITLHLSITLANEPPDAPNAPSFEPPSGYNDLLLLRRNPAFTLGLPVFFFSFYKNINYKKYICYE